ncbi:MAG: hypothetical protein WDZ46_07100 [Solirubrobacterales bacterium]
MKRLGPELKMPDLKGMKNLKVPPFAADVYYDLRDRRLLPLVALVVVAIAAVPFLLGGDGDEPAPPAAGPTAAQIEDEVAGASRFTVVEAQPGLRDYRKRLRNRTPTNPFKQRYTSLPESAMLKSTTPSSSSSGEGSSSEESVTIEDGSTTVEVEPGDSGGSGGGKPDGSGDGGKPDRGSGGGTPTGSGLRLIEFRFNIQISRTEETADGGQKMGEPQVRRRVRTLTQLPGKKAPVVTVAGVNLHNGKVFFLVSDDVRSLDGEFVCKTRTPGGICELLEIEPGFPLELVYGPNEVRYRFKVIKIDAVWGGKPGAGASSTRAAFGGPALDALPAG